MTTQGDFEIFLSAPPGQEAALCEEARTHRFGAPEQTMGGVTVRGGWPEVWRANLELRGANRVIARIASFRAFHLAQLDKRSRRVPWGETLRADIPFRVEATCRTSRIYHSGAAAQRVEKAIREELGAPLSPNAEVCIRVRFEDDLCTIGIDTSGELLHKRGFKEAVNKAPMRETMAALFLRQCSYTGTETVVDPMCGSGTFIIEAAEMAAGLNPGRSRAFAFERLASFDAPAWQAMRAAKHPTNTCLKFYGSDRDAGAIEMSRANAARAGITDLTEFRQQPISSLEPPPGPPGLVILNPPYGDRIGDKASLYPLYRATGQTLMTRFSGWRAAIVTNDRTLASATGLPFAEPGPPVAHGGLRVTLFATAPLK